MKISVTSCSATDTNTIPVDLFDVCRVWFGEYLQKELITTRSMRNVTPKPEQIEDKRI
jgi:hypothetical protein